MCTKDRSFPFFCKIRFSNVALHKKQREGYNVFKCTNQNGFLISLVLAVLALLGAWVISIPVISGNAFLVMLVAYVVLAAGNILKGM